MPGPKSGLRLVKKVPDDVDPLLVEKIRVTIKAAWNLWRDLEAYKLKRGICVMGMTCMRKAVEGKQGGKRGCPHHMAASKAGIRLFRKESYQTEYGKLQEMLAEQEKKQVEQEKKAKKLKKARKPAAKRKAA